MAKGRVVLDQERCKGCGLCVSVCPKEILVISSHLNERGYLPVEVTDMDQCTGCGVCAVICPDVCIAVYRQVPVRRQRAVART
jgi:2-oxoglutarate ferredoxin oxidoreductase subunit delta